MKKLFFMMLMLVLASGLVFSLSGCGSNGVTPDQAASAPLISAASTSPPGTAAAPGPSGSVPSVVASSPTMPPSTVTDQNIQPTYQDAPVTINADSDGRTLHVNLVKFAGSVSGPEDKVTVNGIPAVISSDGSYGVFLDLTPGKNTIDVRTVQNTDTFNRTITVTFTPPLTVYLNSPHLDNSGNTDYSQTPLDITGRVSNPQADVTVGGKPVNVSPDGTFSTQLVLQPHQLIEAIATSGDEADTDTLNLFQENGQIGIVPGVSVLQSSHINFTVSDNITPGETLDLTADLAVRKDVQPGSSVKFDIMRIDPNSTVSVSGSGVEATELPMLPDLQVSINPTEFTLYPNVIYHPTITIRTKAGLTPGTYRFLINTTVVNGFFSSGPLIINVEP